jgi:hypothetical protein
MKKVFPVSRGIETHPYRVNNLAELPASLQAAAQSALGPTEQPERIFLVPNQTFFKNWFSRRYVPQQALLFTAQGVLHVQEAVSPDQPVQTTYLHAASLLFVQLRLLLLYGRLELVGQANGALARVVVEFNTVGVSLLLPGLRRLMTLTWESAEPELPVSQEGSLPEFENLPLKFKNGLRLYGLQPGECLLGLVFQPGLWERHGSLFQRQVATNTLLALTNRDLVIVEEERTGWKNPYGWILTFCPLACVKGFEAAPGELWQELQLHLTRDGITIDRPVTLERETMQAWQNLWSHYHVSPN